MEPRGTSGGTRFIERVDRLLRELASSILKALVFVGRRAGEHLGRLASSPVLRRRVWLVGRDFVFAGVLAISALGAGGLLFERVEPGTVGVRQVNWGSERAVGASDRPPGLYFGPRPLYTWHHLDARTQKLDFAPASEGGEHPPLELRSASGITLSVSVSVPYRIVPGEAHAIVRDGLKLSWPMRVKSTVENVLAQELSKLDAEGFADPARRQEVCARSLARLNAELAVHHVAAEGVFVRGFQYAPTYERKKLEEQLAGQTLETQDVLVELKRKKLENEFLSQALELERAALAADWGRRIQAEASVWIGQRVEDQKIENQFLALALERQKQEALARLAREFEQAKRDERELALETQQLATREVGERTARDEAAHALALQRALAEEARVAEAEIAARRARNELAAAELARAEQALAAELDLAAQSERIASEREARAIESEAEGAARDVRTRADRAFVALVAEGERERAEAEALHERLAAEAFAHPGARAVLAREAASNLRFERVALDANDARVPSVLDLDALAALLIGAD